MAKDTQTKKPSKADKKTRSSASVSAKDAVLGTPSMKVKAAKEASPAPTPAVEKMATKERQKERKKEKEEKSLKKAKGEIVEERQDMKEASKKAKGDQDVSAAVKSVAARDSVEQKGVDKKRKRKQKGKAADADTSEERVLQDEPAQQATPPAEEVKQPNKKKSKAEKNKEEDRDVQDGGKTEEPSPKKAKSRSDGKKKPTGSLLSQSAPPAPAPAPAPAPSSKKPKSTPLPVPAAPSSAAEDEQTAEDGAAASEDESVHLHGFSDSEDSSDDEDFTPDADPVELAKLPTIAKDDATVKRRLDKAKRHPTEDRGVIYIGRLPHGFYEDQMRGYFSQFGAVTRLRLSRNKKTGRSKHYAFVEFASSEVAKIVADTMNNYLLLGHILQCRVIPKEEVHPELWVGANRKWRVVPRDRIARVQHNKPRTPEEQEKAERRLLSRQDAKKRKLQELGIKYDLDEVSYKKSKPATA
ncbi:hypothetical protein GLOTRDRAFT_140451 [Gloeophyllum trabeum ATCC 11539]|uniref:RRM domain-containing protein n=1 Tax=Gloeophyllum trabeum (strain ATCC 11539 / FP-39264 / Madison 617) TaxID=670483 RepID=S7PZZ8_GLOTA|nr:uncharacterized protein GLOTRDRAFT_140451 [Gloeophyllum trabeum ATCC 11539]EPQ52857.1 hypothetical protein GLOTRDRAFT_140451 [Gloeophyllum trabeum ATCC 11539]